MSKRTTSKASRLWAEWQNAVVTLASEANPDNVAAEQAALDALVGFVEANGLNDTEFDPRTNAGSEEAADEEFERDYPLTSAMADGRTPQRVAQHGKRRSMSCVEEWETYIEEAIAETAERDDLVALLRRVVREVRAAG